LTWSFDADVLIYAAEPEHALGEETRTIIDRHPDAVFGSVLLLPETLAKSVRGERWAEIDALAPLLGSLTLVELTEEVADLSVVVAARYRLRAADAVHLASAIWVGAEHFITNNRRDFAGLDVSELDVVFPRRDALRAD
jgi:predicted nucleic acid-binding protein